MIKILFVCHGNICRSPMAEFVMKDIVKQKGLEATFEIASCATSREEIGNDTHRGTKQKLDEMHIPYQKRCARQLTKQDYQSYDYIIGMDRRNVSNILRIIEVDSQSKVFCLLEFASEQRDIADPWYTNNFDATYNDVLKGCMALFHSLEDNKNV